LGLADYNFRRAGTFISVLPVTIKVIGAEVTGWGLLAVTEHVLLLFQFSPSSFQLVKKGGLIPLLFIHSRIKHNFVYEDTGE
jgi:hypothetical protein